MSRKKYIHISPLTKCQVMLMLDLESCVLGNYERESTAKAREPKRGKGKAVNLCLNSFLSSLVQRQAFQSLQQIEDDHVGTKLETELWEGGSHCLAQVKVIPEGQK